MIEVKVVYVCCVSEVVGLSQAADELLSSNINRSAQRDNFNNFVVYASYNLQIGIAPTSYLQRVNYSLDSKGKSISITKEIFYSHNFAALNRIRTTVEGLGFNWEIGHFIGS